MCPTARLRANAHRHGPLLALLLVLLSPVCSSGQERGTDQASVELGRSLYRDGQTPSGVPLRGTIQGDVPVSGAQLACISCHRRSGLGSSEGSNLAPPVTGPALYAAREKHQREWPTPGVNNTVTRPAYTDASLRRALLDGIDAAGRPLDPLMPRYALDETQVDALIAYLKGLGSEPAPGVTGESLHLATIITPGADPQARETMLQVLNTFFDDKNARTRNETQRSARAPWHLSWKLEAYRDVQLHVWTVEGTPDTWHAQLEAHYSAQPVFAVISGIGAGDWQPVHAFCEARELPCLFPNTSLPDIHGDDFYSVYFNQGMALEARVAARFLSDAGLAQGPVLQIINDAPAEHTAAEVLRGTLAERPHELQLSSPITRSQAAAWRALLEQHRPKAVVFWGTHAQLQTLLTELAASDVVTPAILISSTLTISEQVSANPALQEQLYWIHPYSLAQQSTHGEARVRAWLRSRKLEPGDMRTALNTYFAAAITTGAINMLINRFSREYLIERIEHSTENALVSGAYPRLSLGPNQRYASKGAYVVRLANGRQDAPQPQAEWIIP